MSVWLGAKDPSEIGDCPYFTGQQKRRQTMGKGDFSRRKEVKKPKKDKKDKKDKK
jgi:hypothetical protein